MFMLAAFLILKSWTGAAGSFICPQGWTLFNQHCYYVVQQQLSWDQAKAVCEAVDSWLVEVESAAENNFLFNLTNKQTLWIGLTDKVKEGTFVWAASRMVLGGNMYKNWGSGQPDGGNYNEDCAEMWAPGVWNDLPCSFTTPNPLSVCERYAYILG